MTSLAAEGLDVPMAEVVDAVVARAATVWGDAGSTARMWPGGWRPRTWHRSRRGEGPGRRPPAAARRSTAAGRDAGAHARPAAGRGRRRSVRRARLDERKPEWLRVKARMGQEYRSLQRTVRQLDLVTVCEEAGCPNIYECWADGTATFMINGDRCTRACGFCLVDTRKPLPPTLASRAGSPRRSPGWSGPRRDHHRRPRRPRRRRRRRVRRDRGAPSAGGRPATAVELLIPDCKGDPAALETIFAARPDVLNHNVETVPRLQRAVRPSASYARSLAVLARAKAAGLTTKSGLIVGMGETFEEVMSTLADLQGVGVDIVTVGQYLRPTSHHLPVARWWTPRSSEGWRSRGRRWASPTWRPPR